MFVGHPAFIANRDVASTLIELENRVDGRLEATSCTTAVMDVFGIFNSIWPREPVTPMGFTVAVTASEVGILTLSDSDDGALTSSLGSFTARSLWKLTWTG